MDAEKHSFQGAERQLLGKHVSITKQQVIKQQSMKVSLISGAIAGGAEAFITYPFEFAKTITQLNGEKFSGATANPLRIIINVARTQRISAVYAGCLPLVGGCMGKAGVRFATFDTIKAQLADSTTGKLSPARGILAGVFAGITESLLAVTPTERIKTAIIDDAKGTRRFRGSWHATTTIMREGGVLHLYRGCLATTVKQAATSGVRMGSYNAIKGAANTAGLDTMNTVVTFALGAIAGTITVYATQPFDTIKTRTQSVGGAGVIQAFRGIMEDSGVPGLWKGSTMRLGRLWLSGGIIFSIYERTSELLGATGL